MRKKIMIAAAILVMCFAFVSCGKSMADSPYVGTWKAVNASYSGIEMSVESIIGGEMTFELRARRNQANGLKTKKASM